MLNLKNPQVRAELDHATTTAKPVYMGQLGTDYGTS